MEYSAGGVVVRDGKVVLSRSKHGWSFPKGHVKSGETTLDAALREIEEESGIDALEFVRELGVVERSDGGTGKRKKITLFLFTTTQDVGELNDEYQTEAAWFGFDEVGVKLGHFEDQRFWMRVVDGLKKEFL